jgi:xylose isomerase
MRNYLILKEKVQRFNEDREIQDLLKEIHGAHPDWAGAFSRYSKDAATRIKNAAFDVQALTSRRLPYERLDQLVTELLLGVR